MVKYYYKNLRGGELKELDKPQPGTWVHAEAPSEKEIADLVKRFKLDEGIVADALDEDEQPRLEREGQQSYIFVRYAYRTNEGDVDTAPLLIMFDSQVFITISLKPLPAVDALLRGKNQYATTQSAKMILLILSHISEQYDVFIGQTTRKIKTIRSRLRGNGITNQDFIDFATIEDELSEFMSSLLPTNATLRRLLAAGHLPMFEADQDIVEDLLLNNEQSIEASKSNLRAISNIRDAYSAISANNLNKTITLLTLVTILIALPNVFFGLYGMNVALPGEHSNWTFPAILGFNLVLITTIVIIARRKRVI